MMTENGHFPSVLPEELERDERFARQIFQCACVGDIQESLLQDCHWLGKQELGERLLALLKENPLPREQWGSPLEAYEAALGIARKQTPAKKEPSRPAAPVSTVPDDGTIFHYCRVRPAGDARSYVYLLGPVPAQPGDWVEIPFGRDNAVRRGQVLSVQECTRTDAPFPPERTKTVLRRVSAPPQEETPDAAAPQRRKKVPAGDPEAGSRERAVMAAFLAEKARKEEQEARALAVKRRALLAVLRGIAQKKARRQKRRKGLLVLLAILLAAGGALCLFWHGQYTAALNCMEQGEYTAAARLVQRTPAFWGERDALLSLAQAGAALEEGETGALKEALTETRKFEDSGALSETAGQLQERLTEALYQKGLTALEEGRGAEAVSCLAAVDGYQDAGTLRLYAAALRNSASASPAVMAGAQECLEKIPEDYAGAFSEEIAALRAALPEMIAAAEEEQTQRKAAVAQAEEARIAALEATGLPYIGMSESEIGTTRQMGEPPYQRRCSEYVEDKDGNYNQDLYTLYTWYAADETIVMNVKCRDGKVSSVEKCGGDAYWDGDTLRVALGTPAWLSRKSGSTTTADTDPYNAKDYNSYEDFYEDHWMDFDGLDEAELYYDEHHDLS